MTAQFYAVIHNAVSPKPPEKLPILISVPEAAKHLGYNLRHFYQLIQDGRFPVVRIGRRTLRVDTEKLKAYMRASEAVKPRAIIDRKTKRTKIREAGVHKGRPKGQDQTSSPGPAAAGEPVSRTTNQKGVQK